MRRVERRGLRPDGGGSIVLIDMSGAADSVESGREVAELAAGDGRVGAASRRPTEAKSAWRAGALLAAMERVALGGGPIAVVSGDGRTPFSWGLEIGRIERVVDLRAGEVIGLGRAEAERAIDAAAARAWAGSTRGGASGACSGDSGGMLVVEAAYELGAAFEPRSMALTERVLAGGAEAEAVMLRLSAVRRMVDQTSLDGAMNRTAVEAESPGKNAFEVGPLRSSHGRAGYEAAVARAVEYIHAGDVFQTNVAHALSAPFVGSTRAAFAAACERLRPAFAAYVERASGADAEASWANRATMSWSPELFVDVDAAGRATTRPIKGTRELGSAGELDVAAKDLAELNMIVDLMRNDLGRVAEIGSVRVDEARRIESHHAEEAGAEEAGAEGTMAGERHGVAHGVATVSARLRGGVGLGALLGAAFPPGSVTGAPKVRAMQIIDELERRPGFEGRGVYCGAVGVVRGDGQLTLSVGIRTATVEGDGAGGRRLVLPVGAGIVADSEPDAEWIETLVKAAPIVAALGASVVDDAAEARA